MNLEVFCHTEHLTQMFIARDVSCEGPALELNSVCRIVHRFEFQPCWIVTDLGDTA